MTANTSPLKILFLCTGNSCRSQMAEGWARFLKGGSIQPYSAGTQPHALDLRALQVMKECGVDISQQASKHVDSLGQLDFDFVITVCDSARESCPIFGRGAQMVHVGFDDPPRLAAAAKTEEEALGHYRRVRDEIKKFIETLPEAL